MKYILSSLALSLLAVHAGARADDGEAKLAAWPPKITFAGGTELSLGGNLQYDAARSRAKAMPVLRWRTTTPGVARRSA